MASVRTPRRAWIDTGLRAMAEGGVDAVRVEVLARTLGVTKGGFYWHFDDRGALLEEMLATWEHAMVDEVIEQIEASGGDARTRLRQLFAMASDERISIDLAVRDWARREQAVAARLRVVDNRRMAYLRRLFGEFCDDEEDVESRALLILALWVGTRFIAADHGARTRSAVVRSTLERLLV